MKPIFAASLAAIPALVLSLALPSARAQVLFDDGASPGWTGNAHELTGSIQAEDFTLADPVTIMGIRFCLHVTTS